MPLEKIQNVLSSDENHKELYNVVVGRGKGRLCNFLGRHEDQITVFDVDDDSDIKRRVRLTSCTDYERRDAQEKMERGKKEAHLLATLCRFLVSEAERSPEVPLRAPLHPPPHTHLIRTRPYGHRPSFLPQAPLPANQVLN